MPSTPLSVVFCPQVRRPEFITGFQKPLRIEPDVLHNFMEVRAGEFAAEPADERHALLARQVLVSDLLRRVVRRTPEAELDESRVVVEPVNAVVEAVVLAVRTFGPDRVRPGRDPQSGSQL